jgi:hypothetical protein
VIAHLLKETKENERERLIVKLIPQQHLEVLLDPLHEEGTHDDSVQLRAAMDNLSRCYRIVFKHSNEDTKKKAVAAYVALVKRGDDIERAAFENAFFVPSDLKYCSQADTDLIIDHLLSRLGNGKPILRTYEGMGAYLTASNVFRFFEPLLKLVTSPPKRDPVEVREFLTRELHNSLHPDLRQQVIKWLENRLMLYSGDAALRIRSIIDDIPF